MLLLYFIYTLYIGTVFVQFIIDRICCIRNSLVMWRRKGSCCCLICKFWLFRDIEVLPKTVTRNSMCLCEYTFWNQFDISCKKWWIDKCWRRTACVCSMLYYIALVFFHVLSVLHLCNFPAIVFSESTIRWVAIRRNNILVKLANNICFALKFYLKL